MWNSRFSAMAEPITSARSHAAIAISQSTQRPMATGRRIVVAARLREIASGDDAELGREPLQQHRHEVREQHDAEQRVAEARAAGEVGRPVAGVHVADGDEIARAGEGEQLAKEAAGADGHAAIDVLQARRDARMAPPVLAGMSRLLFRRSEVGAGHAQFISRQGIVN